MQPLNEQQSGVLQPLRQQVDDSAAADGSFKAAHSDDSVPAAHLQPLNQPALADIPEPLNQDEDDPAATADPFKAPLSYGHVKMQDATSQVDNVGLSKHPEGAFDAGADAESMYSPMYEWSTGTGRLFLFDAQSFCAATAPMLCEPCKMIRPAVIRCHH